VFGPDPADLESGDLARRYPGGEQSVLHVHRAERPTR
jgi:hypothetical protein